ncbi:MAG: VWA domain-containing protein, partial [Bdellovibrionales bacterium]|nr:VWA domain-containing protein [Bdellovibrionales bacterium]
VEILFVIDDSGSMQSHQENLKRNAVLFVSALNQSVILDYRIGVTTTSDKDKGTLKGSLGSYVTPRTVNGMDILAQSMIVGTNGDATERVLSQIMPVLTNPAANFSRRGSYLAVVFVTDAEDQSKLDPATIYNEMVNFKGGDPEKVLVYGAYVPPGVDGCSRDGGEQPKILETFLNLASGGANDNYFNLCSPTFGSDLANIADDIVEKVGSRITLDKAPDPATIVVRYGNLVIPNHPQKGWTYDPATKSIYLGREIDWPEEDQDRELTIDFRRAIFPEEREHAKK